MADDKGSAPPTINPSGTYSVGGEERVMVDEGYRTRNAVAAAASAARKSSSARKKKGADRSRVDSSLAAMGGQNANYAGTGKQLGSANTRGLAMMRRGKQRK